MTYTTYIYICIVGRCRFTRRYFEKQLGIELEPMVDVRLPERTVPRAKTPPYTGYGSWEDSMGSVMHLVPKLPKKERPYPIYEMILYHIIYYIYIIIVNYYYYYHYYY